MTNDKRAAFFDVDDTLINLKSMFDFQRFYFRHAPEHEGDDPDVLDQLFSSRLKAASATGDRSELNAAYYRTFAGRRQATVGDLADTWFSALQERLGAAIWVKAAIELAERARGEGLLLVGVTGASHDIIAPIIDFLNFDGRLATTLECHDGVFTGEIQPPQMIGIGKAQAISLFAEQNGVDLRKSIACGDHSSDLSMLDMVGESYVVAGDPDLECIARERGWAILQKPVSGGLNPHI